MSRTNFKKTLCVFALVMVAVVFVSAVVPQTSSAQVDLLTDISGFVTNKEAADLGLYINAFIRLMIAIATGLAVVMIVVGGVTYMLTGSVTQKANGKEIIQSALWGLLLALSTFVILQTINKDLVNLDFIDTIERVGKIAEEKTPRGASPDVPDNTPSDGRLDYDDGILEQRRLHASGPLDRLLTCMAAELPGNTGRVSSISDSLIVDGHNSFKRCANEWICQHRSNSCHYGGSGRCNGMSYAVDFGDQEHRKSLIDTAVACSRTIFTPPIRPAIFFEGDHIHVSIGAGFKCGCN